MAMKPSVLTTFAFRGAEMMLAVSDSVSFVVRKICASRAVETMKAAQSVVCVERMAYVLRDAETMLDVLRVASAETMGGVASVVETTTDADQV